MTIKFYKTNGPHGFMNNFKKARMYIGGRWWNNVEAPYQAAKTVIKEEEDAIWAAKTPREARDLGQKVKMRPDWDQVKDKVMYECVLAKFLQHPDLRKELMKTDPEELVEDSPIDSYWGCGADGAGKNMLGKTLMRVRLELRGE
jgi:ribA/ribD-fused uncharacterized protein